MTSRWSSVAVVLFWLTSMGWLVERKIVPSWLDGDPPTYRTVLKDSSSEPVGWAISLDRRPLGWAVSQVCSDAQGAHTIRSRVQFSQVPIVSLAPSWVQSVFKLLDQKATQLLFDLDATTVLGLDPLGRPLEFRSVAELGRLGKKRTIVDPIVRMGMRGVIEGNQLKLTIRSGESVSRVTTYIPDQAMLGDALGPQERLPNLRVGQSWNWPVYNPMRQQMEILQATVEGRDTIHWNRRDWPVLLVELRGDPGAETTRGQNVRARCWVAPDGLVLAQEVVLSGSRLRFERVARKAAHEPTLDEPLEPWW